MILYEQVRNLRFYALSVLLWTLIVTMPAAVASLPIFILSSDVPRLLGLPIALLVFATAYPITCGVLSLPFQGGIQAGIIDRDLGMWKYARRRLYGQCWTAVYYFTPLYNFWLSVPPLKAMLFYIFGYRGPTAFTIYADSWIRDLPLLTLGQNSYISNCAVLGTNVVLSNGMLLVDRIVIGKLALIGHGAKLAPGVRVDDGAEIGVATACGIGVHVQSKARVGFNSTVGHSTIIGHLAVVGNHVCIGQNVALAPRTAVNSGAVVPDEATVDACLESFANRQESANTVSKNHIFERDDESPSHPSQIRELSNDGARS